MSASDSHQILLFIILFSKGALVFLLPIGLVSKRRFSRKYPICLVVKRSEEDRRSAAAQQQSQEHSLADTAVRNVCCSVLDIVSDNVAAAGASKAFDLSTGTATHLTIAN